MAGDAFDQTLDFEDAQRRQHLAGGHARPYDQLVHARRLVVEMAEE